jgi:SAM-dependent methyltransferase
MGTQFPEGFDVEYVLRESLEGQLPVLEVGCGVGRIAQLFSPSEYIGVDVNPYALMAARNGNPHHLFRISDVGLQYPQAPSVLVYTVLLHVSDDEIRRFLAEICLGRRRVVIAELMDRRWRRSGFPPVFNRDPEEYVLLMQELGFTISKFSKHEYARYSEPPFNIGKDSRLTTLVFFRNNGA